MSGWLETLRNYEAVAVWLEGIALVLIFVWDRWDFYRSHKETVAQLKVAQDQISAMQNAERAWVLTELDWPSDGLRVVHGRSKQAGRPEEEHTTVSVMLQCRNEGRSPAFVDKIRSYGYIANSINDLPPDVGQQAQHEAIPVGPLAPGKSAKRFIQLKYPAQMEDGQLFRIFVVVEYRDIFNHERVTTCGYTVYESDLYRDDAEPERNKFT